MAIGMSVPGMSAAGTSLGLGGDSLSQQLQNESAEERKKRLQLAQQKLALGPAAQSLGLGGYGASL
jgi:hypothetical protein